MATVVVAEDDADLLASITCALTRAGHSVVACRNADHALSCTRDRRPDLVVTDVDMPPGISGLDMLVTLRADPALATVPVVVVTGGPVRPDVAAALGATLLLRKPVPPGALLAQIEAVLAGQHSS